MKRCWLLAGAFLLLEACDAPSQSSTEPARPPPRSNSHVSASFAEAVGRLAGGETRADLVAVLGAPTSEDVNCSKDRECSRKFFSLTYCFPDKDACSNGEVQLFLNERDQLFKVHSEITQVPQRDFPGHFPSWMK